MSTLDETAVVPRPFGSDDDPALNIQADPPETATSSLADRVRAKHRKLKAGNHLDLPIPGLDLVVRYKPVSGVVTEEIGKRAMGPKHKGERSMIVAKDTLITACVRVFVCDPDDERAPKDGDDAGLIPLEEVFEIAGPPVRFDERLSQAFDYDDGGKARGVVGGIFPTDQAILKAYSQVDTWMADVTRDVTEELLGE